MQILKKINGVMDSPEFIKPNRPIFVCIKHPYHHSHRLRIKGGVIPIDQRSA